MNAPVTPRSGTVRSSRFVSARRRPYMTAPADTAPATAATPGSRNPSGMCMRPSSIGTVPLARRPQGRISRHAQPPFRVAARMSRMDATTLLLFDIDGTLMLRATREHREALHDGIREVYGAGDPASVPVEAGGRTDLEIARLILLGLGVSARRIDGGLRDLRLAAAEAFVRRCPEDL